MQRVCNGSIHHKCCKAYLHWLGSGSKEFLEAILGYFRSINFSNEIWIAWNRRCRPSDKCNKTALGRSVADLGKHRWRASRGCSLHFGMSGLGHLCRAMWWCWALNDKPGWDEKCRSCASFSQKRSLASGQWRGTQTCCTEIVRNLESLHLYMKLFFPETFLHVHFSLRTYPACKQEKLKTKISDKIPLAPALHDSRSVRRRWMRTTGIALTVPTTRFWFHKCLESAEKNSNGTLDVLYLRPVQFSTWILPCWWRCWSLWKRPWWPHSQQCLSPSCMELWPKSFRCKFPFLKLWISLNQVYRIIKEHAKDLSSP